MTAADPFDLERFVTAQAAALPAVLAELKGGRKRTHWMWFVFPQLAGLGRSPTAREFSLSSLDEARAYLRHDILGARLAQCASIVAGLSGRSAEQIFGGIDAMKLRSSMTLFCRADPGQPVFAEVLERYYQGRPDPATDDLLGRGDG